MVYLLECLLQVIRFSMGACVFSFLNVVAWRLPRGESAVRGRSRCPNCGRILTPKELVPCLSYLLQGRRCLGCGGRISRRYFLTELAGGICFLYCGCFFGFGASGLLSWKGLWAFAYLGILTVIALIDQDTRLIYDRFQAGILLLGMAALVLFPEHALGDRLLGAVIVALPMLLLALLIEGAFGGGDIKLMAASGFLIGWKAVTVAVFLALLIGGGYAMRQMAGKKLARKDQIAFGPFLAAGLSAALFYGDAMADWYLSLLF